MLGMSLQTFTVFHVILSLVGIAAGLVVMVGLLTAQRLDAWTAIFMWMTAATSVTGFGFPFNHLLPSHIVGLISLVVLAVAAYARYVGNIRSFWRPVYVVTATIGLYLNVFVLVAQAFLKVPALKALAPTGSEPPFVIAQGATLLIFAALGTLAMFRSRDIPMMLSRTALRGVAHKRVEK